MSFLGLFGDRTPQYQRYASQMRQLEGRFDPYVSAGERGLEDLSSQYHTAFQRPQFLEDELSRSYHMSPYAQAEEKELQRVLNNEAALTGKLGSTYSANRLADTIHRLISSDMDKYISRGMGTYGQALSGYQAFPQMGFRGLSEQTGLGQRAAQADLEGALSRQRAKQSLGGFLASLGTNLVSDFINPSSMFTSSGGGGSASFTPSGDMGGVGNINVNPSDFVKFLASGGMI